MLKRSTRSSWPIASATASTLKGEGKAVMHPRLSIHQVGFAAQSLADFAAACERMGARQLTLISPSLLAEGTSSVRAALAGRDLRAVNVAHGFSAGSPLSDRAGWDAARDTLNRVIDSSAEL